MQRKDIAIAYQALFSDKELDSNIYAERVYNDLCEHGYKERMTDVKGGNGVIDPIATAINNGKRFMILRIDEFRKDGPERRKAEGSMTEEATTTETTEAPTFASFVGEGGVLNDGWKDTISEEYRGEKCLDLFTDVNGMVKTLVHSQKAFGKDKVVVPGEHAAQDDIDAFQKAWGKPETVGDYSFKRDESIPEEIWRGERVDAFLKGAFERGFNSNQVEYIESFYNEMIKDDLSSAQESTQQEKESAETALKEEWGSAYEERLHLAKRVINDTTEAGEDRESLLDAVGNNPIVAKWAANLGLKLVESKSVDTKVHMQTPGELEAELATMMGEPSYISGAMKQNNPIQYKQHHAKVTELNEQLASV